MYSDEELGFILYNNRSKNLVKNFIPNKINPYMLIKIENILEVSKSKFDIESKFVEINKIDLDMDCEDVLFNPIDIKKLTKDIKNKSNKFNKIEKDYLIKRGITKSIIEKWNILGLSKIKKSDLEIIGAKVHPILKKILVDGIDGGGILIPLFNEKDELINCCIRKISIENTDKKTLKYTLSCPDIDIWKSNNVKENDEIYITEGIFDMIAIESLGYPCVTCSSAVWSGIQLYKLLEIKPSKINIFSDNDKIGLKNSATLKDFFENFGIDCDILISDVYKDAADHILKNKREFNKIKKMDIDFKYINNIEEDNSFDFINHLKNRKF